MSEVKSEDKDKLLRFVEAKGKNTRIFIYLQESKEGNKYFIVITRRLTDFKKREITTSSTKYSIETFAVLSGLMDIFLQDSEIKNKTLLKELSDIVPFDATTNINQK